MASPHHINRTYEAHTHYQRYLLKACERSFNFFCIIVGFPPALFHREWTDFFLNNKSTVIAAPRNHGKSYWIFLMIIWVMLFPNKWREKFGLNESEFLKISYITSTDKIIRIQLKEFNMLLKLAVRKLKIESQILPPITQNTETIELLNDSKLYTSSLFGAIRGIRAHMGFNDDLMKDKGQIVGEVIFTYESTVIPIYFPDSMYALLGTVKADNDIIMKNLNNNFAVGKLYKAINIDDNKQVYALWEEERSLMWLHEKKKELTPVTFSREFQNEPVSDEFAVMPLDLLQSCNDHDMSLKYKEKEGAVYVGVDLARSQSKTADYTVAIAFQVLSKYKDRKLPVLKILDIWIFHASEIKKSKHPVTGEDWIEPFYRPIIKKLKNWTEIYKPTKVFIENNQFQDTIVQMVKDPDLVGSIVIPAEGVTTGRNKHDEQKGIPMIRSMLQSGRIIFPMKDNLSQQFMTSLQDELGKWIDDPIKGKYVCTAQHDDRSMAMYTGLTGILPRIEAHTGMGSVANPAARVNRQTIDKEFQEFLKKGDYDRMKQIAIPAPKLTTIGLSKRHRRRKIAK